MNTVTLYYDNIDYTITVRPDKNDFIAFLWEKQFGIKFNPYLYKYEDKEGEFYHKLEDDWLHNRLDEYGILKSTEFLSYLEDKYKDYAYDLYFEEQDFIAQSLYEQYLDYAGTDTPDDDCFYYVS